MDDWPVVTIVRGKARRCYAPYLRPKVIDGKSSFVFPSDASIWKVSLTYFASTPTSDTAKNLLCRNRIAPSTALQKGLLAKSGWLETAINNCPSAAAF